MNRFQAMVARLTGIDGVITDLEKRGSWEVVLQAWNENRANASGAITPGTSLQVAAVWACVRVLSETVASLPLILYERKARGKERATNHPLYPILHDRPNPVMTSLEFREVEQQHLAMWGNAYSQIIYDDRGRVTELWPMRPDRMEPMLINGSKQYRYQLDNGSFEMFTDNEIWHLHGPGDGLMGYSPIGLMRRSIGLSMDAEEFGARFFQNDARPGIVLEHPGALKAAARDNLRESVEDRHQGAKKSHKVMILEEGMKLHEVGIPPEDAQFLETRQFQVREIARIFRVPPHMIGDLEQATFSNIEHQSLEFVVHSIRPWLVRWEQSITSNLILPRERARFFPEHLVDGLLRGDIASRYQAYAVARQNGWMSANDIRELENQNPIDGGDMYLVPLNMIPADQVGDMNSQEEAPPPAPVDTARSLPADAETRALRSAGARHRLSLAHQRVFLEVAERTVRREAQDVSAAIRKYFGKRDTGQFLIWLEEFYRSHADWMIRAYQPLFSAYADLVAAEVLDELGSNDNVRDAVDRFIRSYTGSFAAQQAGISIFRLKEAMQRAAIEGRDQEQALGQELDHWQEARPAEIARDQTTRAGNAIAKTVYQLAGIQVLRWVSMGETCPYCRSMNGRKVGITKFFLPAGEKLDVDGVEPLTTTTNIGHPPVHDGCDCLIMAG